MGAPFVDIEFKAANAFFSADWHRPTNTAFIFSHHDFESTCSLDELMTLLQRMRDGGADIAKVAATVSDITECHRLLIALERQTGRCVLFRHE